MGRKKGFVGLLFKAAAKAVKEAEKQERLLQKERERLKQLQFKEEQKAQRDASRVEKEKDKQIKKIMVERKKELDDFRKTQYKIPIRLTLES